MDQNLSDSEFDSLLKKDKHTYLYKLLDYKHETMIPYNQSGKTSQDSRFIHQVANEFYDDGNPDHYVNKGEERALDVIEITRNPPSEINLQSKTSENSQYQAEITTHPSQFTTPHHYLISEDSQHQAEMKFNLSPFETPRQFQNIDNCQRLDGMTTSPPNPELLQFTKQEDPKKQYNSLKGVKFSGDRSAIQAQPEPFTPEQDQSFQDDRLSHPSQAKIVSIRNQTSDSNVLGQSQSAKLRLFNGFPTIQEALKSARECDNDYSEGGSEDRDGHINPSEEFLVPRADLDTFLRQEERSDLHERNLELSAKHFEDKNGTAQDCDYEIPYHENMRVKERGELFEDFNIGHPDSTLSAENSKSGNRTIENNKLGVLGDTNSGSEEANNVHLASSVLSSMMEDLEEGGAGESRTYNDIFNSCHIPAVEDILAMMGDEPAAAGAPQTPEKEAGPSTYSISHGGVYDRGDHSASTKRKLIPRAEESDTSERYYNQLLPAERYEPAANDNLPPKIGTNTYSSVSHDKYSLPAEWNGIPASRNFPQKYGAKRGFFERRDDHDSLAREHGLAVNDDPPSKNGATSGADTNQQSETLGERNFSHEQYRIPSTMQNYPVLLSQELYNIAHPSSFENAQVGRPVAPGVQPQIQMPRPGQNLESDTILPSIEFDIVDENNTAEELNKIPENWATLRPLGGPPSAEGNPDHWGMWLNKKVPDLFFRYSGWLENKIEDDFKTAWMNEQIMEDSIPFIDSNSVAQDTLADQYARECNAKLESESKAAVKGEVIDNATFLQMPKAPCVRPFFFRPTRRPGRPDQRRRMSLTSIRSPEEFSPPKETGPEIPKYDFSSGEVPVLPPDFNTAQEIKRRLLAKNAISSVPYNKRCGTCGYMGHVSNWPGCPALVCELCRQEGHGRGFCPQTDISERWRDRHTKTTVERLRLKKMEKGKSAGILGRPEIGQRSQAIEWQQKTLEDPNARGYSQEALSWRSLAIKRQRLADGNQVRINEEEERAPAANMTAWPMVGAFKIAQTVAPMKQAQINEEKMKAPTAQMATWPMANSSESIHNIASKTRDNWPYVKTDIPEWQPWVDMNIGMLSVPVAQMETGPMDNFFETPRDIEWQPCDDTKMDTQYQETVVRADTTMNRQGYSNGSEVEQYAQYRLDDQGRSFLREPEDSRGASAESAAWLEYADSTEAETESQ